MSPDTTTIGLLVAALSTLAGVIAFLVRHIFTMYKSLIDVLDRNTKAYVEVTHAMSEMSGTNREVIGMVRDHLIPPRK